MYEIRRKSGTSDGDWVRDSVITNQIFYLMNHIASLEEFREKMYRKGIYLSQEEAEKVEYNEINNIDYSLYIDSLSKNLRVISQEDLKREWDKKIKNERRESFLRLLIFSTISSYCYFQHYVDSFVCIGLFALILAFMFVCKLIAKPLTYNVRFIESKDEMFH